MRRSFLPHEVGCTPQGQGLEAEGVVILILSSINT